MPKKEPITTTMALVENNPEKKHGEGNKPEEGAMKKVGDQSSVTNTARAGQVEADQADEKAAAEAKAEAARTVLELTGTLLARAVFSVALCLF